MKKVVVTFSHRFSRRGRVACLLMVVASLFAESASADVFVGPGCAFKTIQKAIDATIPGINVFVAPGTYNELLTIKDHRTLLITGGYSVGCAAGMSGLTTVSGALHPGDSVVTVSGDSDLTLDHLNISDGVESTPGGHGGGIDFNGHGKLRLQGVTLFNNFADFGGGLDVSPDGPAEVTVGANTGILFNSAGRDGGGIHIDGNTRLFILENATVLMNHADRKGGGIDITGPARADIGGGIVPAVTHNDALLGGGISAVANTEDNQAAVVRLFTTDPDNPVTISDNIASLKGGGIYLKNFEGAGNASSSAALCADDFRINGNNAPDGSAIYADFDSSNLGGSPVGSQVFLNTGSISSGDDFKCNPEPTSTFGGVHCAPGIACNEIANNLVGQQAPTSSGTIFVGSDSLLKADRFSMHGNTAGSAIRAVNSGPVEITNCLITGNTVSQELIRYEGSEGFGGDIRNCTLANNTIGANYVIRGPDFSFFLANTIIAEPLKFTLVPGVGRTALEHLLSNDLSTLLSCTTCSGDDPLFVNAPAGDFHLRANSPALDQAPASILNVNFGEQRDLDGLPRAVDLPGIGTGNNPRDIGAYELQTLPPSDRIFADDFE